MRRILLALVLCLGLCMPALAQETNQIRFTWEQVISSDFAGWELYQSPASIATCPGDATMVADIEYTGPEQTEYTTDYQITGQVGDTFYFRMLAKDTNGNKSECSNEVSYTVQDLVPPAIPLNLIIEVVVQP